MKTIPSLAVALLGLVLSLPAAPDYVPVAGAGLTGAQLTSTLEGLLPKGFSVAPVKGTAVVGPDSLSLAGLSVLAADGNPVMTVERAVLKRATINGKVLRAQLLMEGARYSRQYVEGIISQAMKPLEKTQAPRARPPAPEGDGEAPEGQAPAAQGGVPPALLEMVREWAQGPFNTSHVFTLDPGARTLTMEPESLSWGERVESRGGAIFDLDPTESPTLEKALSMVGATGVIALFQGGPNTAVMGKCSPGKLGTVRRWATVKAGHPGLDLLGLAHRLDVKQPMFLGLLGHPAFPARPALRADVRFEMEREGGRLRLSPLTLSCKPGFQIDFDVALDQLDWSLWGNPANVEKAAGAMMKTLHFETLKVSVTDLDGLALVYQVAADMLQKKSSDLKAMALLKVDELSRPGKSGKALPMTYVKAVKDFASGKKATLTLRLKGPMSFSDLEKNKAEFDQVFVIE